MNRPLGRSMAASGTKRCAGSWVGIAVRGMILPWFMEGAERVVWSGVVLHCNMLHYVCNVTLLRVVALCVARPLCPPAQFFFF